MRWKCLKKKKKRKKRKKEKRFIPRGFELGTILSEPIWSIIVDFPAKPGLKIDTFLTLMGTRPI